MKGDDQCKGRSEKLSNPTTNISRVQVRRNHLSFIEIMRRVHLVVLRSQPKPSNLFSHRAHSSLIAPPVDHFVNCDLR
jgi:hypothetical protein